LSLFRYFEVGLRVCDIVVKKLTFAISSPDEFLFVYVYKIPKADNELPRMLCCSLSKNIYILTAFENLGLCMFVT